MFLSLAAFSLPLIYMKYWVGFKENLRYFLWGMFAPLLSTAVIIMWPVPHVYQRLIFGPILEELAKALPIKKGRHGVASGAGFSATENIAYIAVYPEEYFTHALRMLFTSPMHMLVTRQTGIGIAKGNPVSGYLVAVSFHTGWNLLSMFM